MRPAPSQNLDMLISILYRILMMMWVGSKLWINTTMDIGNNLILTDREYLGGGAYTLTIVTAFICRQDSSKVTGMPPPLR